MFAFMLAKPLRSIFLFLAAFITILHLQALTGCANIVPPSGGPRDSLPPRLLTATPPDSTTNFSAQRIQLTFDEYVDLKEVQNNLLFTPTFPPDKNPEVSVRNKTVTVRFRDTLESNTTYIFNFGNAIADYNEGNILRNFVYTFSTGPVIDSLEIKGKVLLAQSGKTDSTLIVVLHKDLGDSAIVKERPVYISRVDRDGNFHFRNLPSGRFAIYALGNAGLSRRYQNKADLFAFSDTAVAAGTPSEVILYAYREEAQTSTTSLPASRGRGDDNRLSFTNNLNVGQQDIREDLVLNFQTPLARYDSTLMSLHTDSTFMPVPFSVSADTSMQKLRISTAWKEATDYHLVLDQNFAEDTAGRKLLKTDTLDFKTRARTDYGKLALRFRNLDLATNPVLQFVQNDKVVYAAPLTSNQLNVELFTPGEYELRLLFDENGNGVWDAGSFFGEKRQPEIVKPIERKLTVKANFDNEIELLL
ncbi:MAG: Ig-like domain-containing protein [Flavisolibacter sp.]